MTFYDLADLARMFWARSVRWLLWSPLRLLAITAAVAAIVIGYALFVVDPDGGGRDSLLETSTLPDGWEQWPVVEVPANDAPAVDQVPETEEPTAAEPTAAEPTDHGHEQTGQDAHTEPDDQDRQSAAKTAFKFAAAYVDVDRNTKKWRKDVARHAIDQLAADLDSVDPKNIDLKLSEVSADEATEIESLGTYGGVIAVDTAPGPLLLNVTNTGNEWVVSRVAPPSPAAD